ncbi:MAG: hypothetical protein LBU65_03515 [Planctomycetaceae bacterium]|jgi:hypothetical protein|nr:hypothetical protein [Planctomycetaceae bacterium]
MNGNNIRGGKYAAGTHIKLVGGKLLNNMLMMQDYFFMINAFGRKTPLGQIVNGQLTR